MRFPDASLEAKAAAAASLARLTPAWAAEWAACSFLGRMRALQSGWACYWRLVYLVHTGQAGTLGLGTTLRMRHSRFALLYPGFAGWLDRCAGAAAAAAEMMLLCVVTPSLLLALPARPQVQPRC